uniref:ubiquitinyl hydrolase 1 n=1 Tax=Ditylenchus dipsaci TaxID=166011 RepID=A0A915E3R2_9BILA
MESNKGKPMGSYNGYLMQQTVKSANGTKQLWRCATRVCHGTAESVFGNRNGLVERKAHDRYQAKMTDVKRKAVENLASSTQAILSAAKKGASVYEIESMPKDSNIKKIINNARKPKGAADVDKDLKDMVLSRDFTTTTREERFLLWDSRVKYRKLKPKSIMADFEQSPAKVMKTLFPSAVMNFCLFHLGQSHYKNLVDWKLRSLYSDSETKALIRSFTSLACLPSGEVSKGFDKLVVAIQQKVTCGKISMELVENLKADPLRNAQTKKVQKNEEQLQALVMAYSAIEEPLRDQVAFLRHIQQHLAKFEKFVVSEDLMAEEEVIFVEEVTRSLAQCSQSRDKLPSFFKGIEADGNCLYRSVAEAVYGDEELHGNVRREMMKFLSATAEEYAAHFAQPSSEPDRWGTSQQLLLAAKLYNKNMVLYQPREETQFVYFSVDSSEDNPKVVLRKSGKVSRVYDNRKVPLKKGVDSVLIRYQNSHFDLGWMGRE